MSFKTIKEYRYETLQAWESSGFFDELTIKELKRRIDEDDVEYLERKVLTARNPASKSRTLMILIRAMIIRIKMKHCL